MRSLRYRLAAYNARNYEKLLEEFNSAFYHVERNANPKILFMDLIMKTNEMINLPA